MVSLFASHADDPGSTPGHGKLFLAKLPFIYWSPLWPQYCVASVTKIYKYLADLWQKKIMMKNPKLKGTPN